MLISTIQLLDGYYTIKIVRCKVNFLPLRHQGTKFFRHRFTQISTEIIVLTGLGMWGRGFQIADYRFQIVLDTKRHEYLIADCAD